MIRVVARSQAYADRFRRRHQPLSEYLTFEFNQTSYFSLINRLIEECDDSIVCIVHDDVTLAAGFKASIDELVSELNKDWPNWGLAGNAGVSAFIFGFTRNTLVRYVADPHGGPNLLGHIVPAQSVDGNVMLLNLAAMHRHGVRLPTFEGFQLYDIILSFEVLKAGLAVVVTPHLACWHDSSGNQHAFNMAVESSAFHEYLRRTVLNRQVSTLNGEIDVPLTEERPPPGRFDLQICSLRNASIGRGPASVAICIRTQFGRPLLLQRALETASAFIAAAGDATRFSVHVVTDRPINPDAILGGARLLHVDLAGGGDSRNRLIQAAAREIDADRLWFVDDDDWLFPNAAERLGYVLNTVPGEALVMVDSQVFEERLSDSATIFGAGYHGEAKRYFPASQFSRSFSGHNYVPMCGMLLSRDLIRGIPDKNFENVEYYEDFSLLLHALLAPGVVPVFIESLFCGISVREHGNSITELDRTKWNKSMAELVAVLSREMSNSLMTMPWNAGSGTAAALQPISDPLQLLNRTDRHGVLVLRAMRTAFHALFKPRRWALGLKSALTVMRDGGLRGLLREMANVGSGM